MGPGRRGGGGAGNWGRFDRNNTMNGSTFGHTLQKPNWNLQDLKPFKKDFYVPHPTVANRSNQEVDQYRRSKEITIEGDAPNPIQNFNEAAFPGMWHFS